MGPGDLREEARFCKAMVVIDLQEPCVLKLCDMLYRNNNYQQPAQVKWMLKKKMVTDELVGRHESSNWSPTQKRACAKIVTWWIRQVSHSRLLGGEIDPFPPTHTRIFNHFIDEVDATTGQFLV